MMISQIQATLQEKNVVFAYLFGSETTGRATKKSDIDIAVFLKEKDEHKRFETKIYLMGKLPTLLKKDVDIVVLNDVQSNYLLAEILHKGTLIFDTDKHLRFHFETTKQHEMLDFFTHIEYANK